MKKVFSFFAGILFFACSLFADVTDASEKASPIYFAGVGSSLCFPSFSKKSDGASGFGGSGFIEAGLDYKNFQAEAILGYTHLSGGKGLLQQMDEVKVGLGAGYVLDRRNIKFMPNFVAVRPHLSVFADFYSAKLYKNVVLQEEGVLSVAKGVTSVFNAGLFVDFPNLLYVAGYNLVPNIGFEECFRFDVSGLYATPILTVGCRLYFDKKTPPPKQQTSYTEQQDSRTE